MEAGLPHSGLSFGDELASGRLTPIILLVLAEAGLGILSDLLGRGSTLVGSLLGQLYADAASLALMRHAATLDLEQFESSEQQDRLERARRQVTGRTAVLQTVFGQLQDAITVIALAVGSRPMPLGCFWCCFWRSSPQAGVERVVDDHPMSQLLVVIVDVG